MNIASTILISLEHCGKMFLRSEIRLNMEIERAGENSKQNALVARVRVAPSFAGMGVH